MRNIDKFENWKSSRIDEGVAALMLQIGVVFGMLGWKAIKSLIEDVASKIGMRFQDEEMSKKDLKKLAENVIKKIEKMNPSDISLGAVKTDIYEEIERGEIKTPKDMSEYFKKKI